MRTDHGDAPPPRVEMAGVHGEQHECACGGGRGLEQQPPIGAIAAHRPDELERLEGRALSFAQHLNLSGITDVANPEPGIDAQNQDHQGGECHPSKQSRATRQRAPANGGRRLW